MQAWMHPIEHVVGCDETGNVVMDVLHVYWLHIHDHIYFCHVSMNQNLPGYKWSGINY